MSDDLTKMLDELERLRESESRECPSFWQRIPMRRSR